MNELLKELESEARQEKILALFTTYRKELLGFCAAIILATAAGGWYKGHRLAKEEAAGARYLEAAGYALKGDDVSAMPRLDKVIAEGAKGWKSLAALQKAALLTGKKNFKEAREVYDTVIADSSADTFLRDYAVVMSAWLILEHNAGEKATGLERLEAMRGPDKPWRFTAAELLAAQAVEDGDTARARAIYTALKDDPLTPTTLQERAVQLLATLPEAPKEEPKKE